MKPTFQLLLCGTEVITYVLARTMTALGIGLLGYCAIVLSIMAWPWSAVVWALLGYQQFIRRRGRLTTLGRARLADTSDLRMAAMIYADRGLIVGRIAVDRSFLARLKVLLSPGISAKQSCLEFWLHTRSHIVRLSRAVHTILVSPSGGGKGVCCIIPHLLTCHENTVTIDPKGENAKITAAHRAKQFGHRIILLDPFCIVTQTPDCFNPLDRIHKESPDALDQCFDLAAALVVRPPDEREPHWGDSAETFIAAVTAVVVFYGSDDEGTRSLLTVRDILSDPERLNLAIRTMRESDAWGGLLARIGDQLLHYIDKEKSSTLTTALRNLRFLNSAAVSASTRMSSFDPAELPKGKIDIFCVLPPDHMRTQSPLLRMWIGAFFNVMTRGGIQETNKVHFVLDEAASLGRMEIIDDAADKLRGYGVRLILAYQSLGQLKKCFPHDEGQTVLASSCQVFFGANDPGTCDYISSRIGEATILVESDGSSYTRQWSAGHNGQESSSYSSNTSHSRNQQARKVLKPEEVAALPPHTAITFAPGVPPIMTNLLRYYEEKRLGKPQSWLMETYRLITTLMLAINAIVFGAGMAVALTMTLQQAKNQPQPGPIEHQAQPDRLKFNTRPVWPARPYPVRGR